MNENNEVKNENAVSTVDPVNDNNIQEPIKEDNNIQEPIKEENNDLPVVDPLKQDSNDNLPVVDPLKQESNDNNQVVEPLKPNDNLVNPATTDSNNDNNVIETNNDPSGLSGPQIRTVNHRIDSLNKSIEEEVTEKKEEVDTRVVNYTPPSKLRLFSMGLFFILILLFVVFLPDITEIISKFKDEEEETTYDYSSGRLLCDYQSNTATLDKDYYYIFYYNIYKLYKAELKVTTRGDSKEDEKDLEAIYNTCENIKKIATEMNGVDVDCLLMDEKVEEQQVFDLSKLDYESFSTKYVEAGGTKMEYKDGQDIRTVQKNLEATGFYCAPAE